MVEDEWWECIMIEPVVYGSFAKLMNKIALCKITK